MLIGPVVEVVAVLVVVVVAPTNEYSTQPTMDSVMTVAVVAQVWNGAMQDWRPKGRSTIRSI